jgi:outer membrane receptor protein involved in Fe transport
VLYWITIRRHIVFLLALTCGGGAIYAQLANTTSLVGTVTDSAGAAMPDVSITAVNTATQDTYKVATNSDGNYTIAFPRIGAYRIEATHAGFQTMTKTGITVDQNQTVRTDFALQVGQVSQNIEVKATTPPISTDDASIREVVGQQAVADLPLNGRDPLQIATLTAGVLPGQKAANGVPPGEDFIGAGTREIQNSVSLDGIAIMNNLITTTPYHPSPDAIAEFEVQTGTYSAQYGAYLGAHLNLVTKSGSNDLHGALWEFFRNDTLDARNFFLSPTAPKAPLRQNQFGFELGGPVWIPKLYDGRNKTFFMIDYEGLRLIKNVTQLDTVLTPLMRQGNFSEAKQLKAVNGQTFPGNIIPPSLISPQAVKALQYMPLPNLPGITNNLTASFPNNDRYNQTIGRLDQNIGSNIRLFFRYAWNNEQYLTGATSTFNQTTLPVQTRNWVVGYTQTLTPNMVNDFRIGRQHLITDALNYWYTNNLTTAGKDIGIPGFDGDVRFNDPGIPLFSNTSLMSIGNGGTNWFQFDTTWQGTDSFTWTHGPHTLIFGAELRKLITSRAAVNSPDGQFNFSGGFTGLTQADFLLGIPISVITPGPELRNQVAEWRDGFYIVDNWQASKKLTLNLGLRYELPTVPYTVNGIATALNAQQTAIIPANAPVPGFKFLLPSHKNFAPRVGFAYRVNDKTVVRAGYGIYYNPNQTNTFTFLSANPPFGAIVTCTSTTATPLISLNNPTPPSACGTASIFNIITPNPDLPPAYMNQWSFDLQRALWNGAALEAQYLGSHSTHLDRSYYNNSPYLPGPGSVNPRRPNTLFAEIRTIQNDENANYHHLAIILRQRMSHGLSFLASYTWSHALDVTTDSNGGGAPMNPYNWRADYGNSNWDVRHRFVAQVNYSLPFFNSAPSAFVRSALGGWQTNAIVALQTGFPFNVVQSGDPANTGRTGLDRPNLVGTASANCGDGHLTGCIDPSAFAATGFAYGNLGRNVLFGPGLYNIDFSAFKNFRIRERAAVQFRSEFFNLFNTPAFSNPNATFGTTNFGSITSTKHDNRQIQFALKFLF